MDKTEKSALSQPASTADKTGGFGNNQFSFAPPASKMPSMDYNFNTAPKPKAKVTSSKCGFWIRTLTYVKLLLN